MSNVMKALVTNVMSIVIHYFLKVMINALGLYITHTYVRGRPFCSTYLYPVHRKY